MTAYFGQWCHWVCVSSLQAKQSKHGEGHIKGVGKGQGCVGPGCSKMPTRQSRSCNPAQSLHRSSTVRQPVSQVRRIAKSQVTDQGQNSPAPLGNHAGQLSLKLGLITDQIAVALGPC